MGRSSGGGYPAQGGYHHQCKSLKIFNHLLWLEEEAHPVVGVTNSRSHLWQRHNGPIMYNLARLQHMVWGLACFLHTMLLPNLPVTLHTINTQVYFAVHTINTQVYFAVHTLNAQVYFAVHTLNAQVYYAVHTLNTQVYFAVFGFTLLLCKKKQNIHPIFLFMDDSIWKQRRRWRLWWWVFWWIW